MPFLFLGLFFYPEDGGNMFHCNVVDFGGLHRISILQNSSYRRGQQNGIRNLWREYYTNATSCSLPRLCMVTDLREEFSFCCHNSFLHHAKPQLRAAWNLYWIFVFIAVIDEPLEPRYLKFGMDIEQMNCAWKCIFKSTVTYIDVCVHTTNELCMKMHF
jgi:hypothetical protein